MYNYSCVVAEISLINVLTKERHHLEAVAANQKCRFGKPNSKGDSNAVLLLESQTSSNQQNTGSAAQQRLEQNRYHFYQTRVPNWTTCQFQKLLFLCLILYKVHMEKHLLLYITIQIAIWFFQVRILIASNCMFATFQIL